MFKKYWSAVSFCSLLLTLFTLQETKGNPTPVSTPVLKTIIIDAGHGLPDPGARGKYSNESDITVAIALKLGKKLEETLPDCKIIYTRTNEHLPQSLNDKNEANRLRAKIANESRGDLFISIHVNSAMDRYRREVVGYKKQSYTTYTGKGKSRKKVVKTRSVPIYKSYKLPCGVSGTETYIWAVNKNDQKKQFVGSNEEDMFGEQSDSTYQYFESPEARILASLRTKKYFDYSRQVATFVEEEFTKQGRRSLGVKQRNNEGIWVLQATAMPSILVETGFICNPDDEDYLNSEKGQNEVSYAVMRAILRYKQVIENTAAPSEEIALQP